jgi:hypothetical protein
MTASHAHAIGNTGKGLDTYIRSIVREMIVTTVGYKNSDMERGNELEAAARMLYEFTTGNMVEEVGFITYNEYVGCSPDGLVGDDGLLELKARNNEIHFNLLLEGEVDSATIWQMNAVMLIADRKWCDFGSYNPNFKAQPLFTKRFYADSVMAMKLKMGFTQGESMIKDLLNKQPIKNEINENSRNDS